MFFICSADTSFRAILVCRRTSSSVTPCSRWVRFSPTQTMTLSPAARPANVRLFTVSSVSAKYWRRSEWPVMTYSTPRSTSMSALISPVKAPLFSKWTFSAPTWMLVPLVFSTAVTRLVKGVQMTTSQPAPATAGMSSSMSAAASVAVLFIFQLPAITALRFALSMVCYLTFHISLTGAKGPSREAQGGRLRRSWSQIRRSGCRRCRAAPCPPGTPGRRRRRWRCGSSCRRSPAASRQPRSRRRR